MVDIKDIQIIRSNRKTISLQIKTDGTIIVRAPLKTKQKDIERFINEKSGWLEKNLLKIKENSSRSQASNKLTDKEISILKIKAQSDIEKRVAFYSDVIGVTYERITIRNQKTRWGSCSSLGNLNFNVALMLCPDEVIDYVVVHELCHRKHPNHSKAFWDEVERFMPDYKKHQKWLKDNGAFIIEKINI